MTAKAQKQALIDNERALNQTETAAILGCRSRDVGEYIEPSYYLAGRPKYITREVLKTRDRMVSASRKVRDRNIKILQEITNG